MVVVVVVAWLDSCLHSEYLVLSVWWVCGLWHVACGMCASVINSTRHRVCYSSGDTEDSVYTSVCSGVCQCRRVA